MSNKPSRKRTKSSGSPGGLFSVSRFADVEAEQAEESEEDMVYDEDYRDEVSLVDKQERARRRREEQDISSGRRTTTSRLDDITSRWEKYGELQREMEEGAGEERYGVFLLFVTCFFNQIFHFKRRLPFQHLPKLVKFKTIFQRKFNLETFFHFLFIMELKTGMQFTETTPLCF